MQRDEGGSHSVVTDVNSLHSAFVSLGYSDSVDRQSQNVMAGFPLLGEAMNNFVGQMVNRVTIANSEEIWNPQLGRDSIRDFPAGTSYPLIGNIPDSDQFMEGIPFSGAATTTTILSASRYGTFENQEKLITLDSCAYPIEYPKTAVAPDNSSNIANSSFETMSYGYEGLPFDSSSKWDFNKFITPELFGRVIGRNGVQVLNPCENSVPNEWILSENRTGMNTNSPGTSRFSNELSLSLATTQPSALHGTSIQEQCSEMSSSGATSYSMHKRNMGSEQTSCSSNNLSLSFNSYKSLQLSPLLSGSRFFHAMQEILAEIACYALATYSTSGIEDGTNFSLSSSCPAGRGFTALDFSDAIDGDHRFILQHNLVQEREVEAKKKRLLALLQVVDDQYNQCLDEVHTVISAFHAVTELDPNLHTRFALPTISSMYRSLRERISSHILAMGAHLNEEVETREEKSFDTSFIQKQWALQQLRKRDPQLWRPQRGLPERSVSVLRAWMFQNFLHPYPKDAEKHLLALKSGLTRSQVSNWFINARVRLWKPMIEEMYAEMSRRKTRRNDEQESDGTHRNHIIRFENRRFTTVD